MLPILPMGTIVTVCMLIGLLAATPYLVSKQLKPLPRIVAWIVGGIVLLGGIWNTFWHGIRHLTDAWGQAALISGVFMMLTGLYLVRFDSLPPLLKKLRPWVLLGLLGWFLIYAIKIASL